MTHAWNVIKENESGGQCNLFNKYRLALTTLYYFATAPD